jgi:ubiquinone/menaquinone biosynthesis C-methylase UbiE
MNDPKQHWEHIYETKNPDELSWTQDVPQTSLDFFRSFDLPKTAKVIDIGGGDSRLVDYLLDEGYENIAVLDISEQALLRAKKRLGKKADRVTWIVSDITAFRPAKNAYDFWHDRAAFHFLTTEPQITTYLSVARTAVHENGYVTIGTFSENGPAKCSGLEVKQYSETALTAQLSKGFRKIRCITEDHTTPFHTQQNFLFCSFRRQA